MKRIKQKTLATIIGGLSLIINFNVVSFGQDMLANVGFTQGSASCNSTYASDNFYNSCVDGWTAAQGTPNIYSYNIQAILGGNIPDPLSRGCGLGCEGIVTTNAGFSGFKVGSKYRITFTVKGFGGAPPSMYYSVLAANNVPVRTANCWTYAMPDLNKIHHKILMDRNNASTNGIKGEAWSSVQDNVEIIYEPEDSFKQLWIYADPDQSRFGITYNTDGAILIDDVRIELIGNKCNSCELTDKYYQNTSSLPTVTKVSNTIYAGSNVTSGTPGNVTILNGKDVIFQAGQNIQLQPGFSIEQGGKFEAKIAACNVNDRLSVSIHEDESIDRCYSDLEANVCDDWSSTKFTYQWSNGATSRTIRITDYSVCYTVTVTDIYSGRTATSTFCRDENYTFQGEFTFDTPTTLILKGCNVLQFNDNWKTTYAYRAYKYELNIYSRWGPLVKTISGTTNRPGFKHGDIWWDGYGVSDGTYRWGLTLWNCTYPNGKFVATDWVEVMGGSCKVANTNGVTKVENSDPAARMKNGSNELPLSQLSVYPNPVANGSFAFTCTLAEGTNTVRFFNSQGSLVKELSINSASIKGYEGNIEVGSLAAGIYHLSLENSNGRESTSVVIQK